MDDFAAIPYFCGVLSGLIVQVDVIGIFNIVIAVNLVFDGDVEI